MIFWCSPPLLPRTCSNPQLLYKRGMFHLLERFHHIIHNHIIYLNMLKVKMCCSEGGPSLRDILPASAPALLPSFLQIASTERTAQLTIFPCFRRCLCPPTGHEPSYLALLSLFTISFGVERPLAPSLTLFRCRETPHAIF